MTRSTRQRSGTRLVGLVAVLALLLAGCGDDDSTGDEGADESAETTGAGEEVEAATITVGEDGIEVSGPVAGNGGAVTLVNDLAEGADAQLVGIGDADLEQFAQDLGPVLEGNPVPDYWESAGGIAFTPPGASTDAAMSLPPGNYAVFSQGLPPTAANLAAVEVTDEGPGLPETDASVTASDYAFDIELAAAGAQTITFANAGPDELHHMVLQAFPQGTSEEDARAAVETLFALPEDQQPPEGTPVPEDVGASAVFSPDAAGTVDLELEADRQYVIACFINDRAGGPPHAIAYGMWDVFSIDDA